MENNRVGRELINMILFKKVLRAYAFLYRIAVYIIIYRRLSKMKKKYNEQRAETGPNSARQDDKRAMQAAMETAAAFDWGRRT